MHDPAFPRLHIRPKQGWINDPNGLCRIDGTYHVFFQYNPDAPVHSNVHWGHVSSSDLIHWDEQPIALRPRTGQIDAAGCWSGCIVDDDGVPTAVYTANPGHARDSTVGLARSDRALQAWTQSRDPVIGVPPDLALDEVRDPFLFRIGGQRYAVQGAGQRFGRPMLLLYGCDDLEHWTELDPLLTDEDPIAGELGAANIWECPNLAYLDGQWVLIISIWRWMDQTHELAGVRYFLGDLVGSGTGWKFKATGGGVLDDGLAFYAPQLMVDGDRTLLWGWAWELGRSEEWISRSGWAGVLTFPRELYVSDGRLCARPVAELTGLRQQRLEWAPDDVLTESAFEVVVRGPATLRLTGELLDEVVLQVSGAGPEPARIFVDGSMVEAYDDGATITTRAYPDSDHRWRLDAAPGAAVIYTLG